MKRPTCLGVAALSLVALLSSGLGSTGQAAAAPGDSRYFPQTGHTVRGPFLQYWEQHGGLAQQGYPQSDQLQEWSATDRTIYTVQYFERAVFELHPQNPPPYEVLLSLLGVREYAHRYGSTGAASQHISTDNPRYFWETRHNVGGKFRAYWEQHGGLAQQGYPLSEEFSEVSPLNGQIHTVQYFERAVFELHPENAGTPYEVLLSQLGAFRYRAKYQGLAIPLPGAGRVQMLPQGSESFLVWDEAVPGQAGSADVLGLNLQTGQALTVAAGSGDQSIPAIAGSLVVWEDHGCGTACGGSDILGKDLATGTTFPVATGPAYQTTAAIAGRSVAWLEGRDDASRLMLKNLDGGPATVVATLPLTNGISSGPTFGQVALSDAYVAWTEVGPRGANGDAPVTLRTSNRQTQEVKTVATVLLPDPYPRAKIVLAGQRLLWNVANLQIADLATGETRQLCDCDAYDPTIRGDLVVWMDEGEVAGFRLPGGPGWGAYLDIATASSITVAGDWVVWQNYVGPNDGRLSAWRLADLEPAP